MHTFVTVSKMPRAPGLEPVGYLANWADTGPGSHLGTSDKIWSSPVILL